MHFWMNGVQLIFPSHPLLFSDRPTKIAQQRLAMSPKKLAQAKELLKGTTTLPEAGRSESRLRCFLSLLPCYLRCLLSRSDSVYFMFFFCIQVFASTVNHGRCLLFVTVLYMYIRLVKHVDLNGVLHSLVSMHVHIV